MLWKMIKHIIRIERVNASATKAAGNVFALEDLSMHDI